MTWIAALPLVALVSCAAVPSGTVGNLNTAAYSNRTTFYLGARKFDTTDWEPVDKQSVFAAEFSHRVSTVGWEVGVQLSRDEAQVGGVDSEGTASELYGGLRLEFGEEVVRPYIGAGVTAISTKLDVDGVGDDDDETLGTYVHCGFTVDLTLRVYLGLDARWVFGSDIELFGVERDVDYGQLALALGFAF